MKTKVNPLIAIIAIVAVFGVVTIFYFQKAGASESDTQLPPDVVKQLKAAGPQPMPPMPTPGGGGMSIPTPNGPPPGK